MMAPVSVLLLWLLPGLSWAAIRRGKRRGVFPPTYSIVRGPSLGNCSSIESSVLGGLFTPSTSGLVPSTLLAIASRRDLTSGFRTDQPPAVQILGIVPICESFDVERFKFNTVTVLVRYTCIGVACEQLPQATRTLTYVHLFSFVCQDGAYTTWDSIYPEYNLHLNRTTTYSFTDPRVARNGSCALCTNDPEYFLQGDRDNSRYDPVTGCVGKLIK